MSRGVSLLATKSHPKLDAAQCWYWWWWIAKSLLPRTEIQMSMFNVINGMLEPLYWKNQMVIPVAQFWVQGSSPHRLAVKGGRNLGDACRKTSPFGLQQRRSQGSQGFFRALGGPSDRRDWEHWLAYINSFLFVFRTPMWMIWDSMKSFLDNSFVFSCCF